MCRLMPPRRCEDDRGRTLSIGDDASLLYQRAQQRHLAVASGVVELGVGMIELHDREIWIFFKRRADRCAEVGRSVAARNKQSRIFPRNSLGSAHQHT